MIKVKALVDGRIAVDGRGYVIHTVKKGDEFDVTYDCFKSLEGKYFERAVKLKESGIVKEKEYKVEKETKDLKAKKETKDLKVKKKTK